MEYHIPKALEVLHKNVPEFFGPRSKPFFKLSDVPDYFLQNAQVKEALENILEFRKNFPPHKPEEQDLSPEDEYIATQLIKGYHAGKNQIQMGHQLGIKRSRVQRITHAVAEVSDAYGMMCAQKRAGYATAEYMREYRKKHAQH